MIRITPDIPSRSNKYTPESERTHSVADKNEKRIWDAVYVLCGNIDASEYKSVVLGLILLKYISDRFEAKYKELVAEGDDLKRIKTNTPLRTSSLCRRMPVGASLLLRPIRRRNVRLSKIRDTLLPKLMSGEIDVSNVSL